MICKLLSTRVFRAYNGGKNIDIMMGAKNPEVSRFPEDWLASVTKAFNPGRNVENEGLSKTEDGVLLKSLIDSNKEEMIGERETMSILFKLLDSDERLVIQVHPTVEFAKKHFNSSYGKTECWYILNDGGYVYLGFKRGVTKEYMKELFLKQDIDAMLSCMHRFDVKKGDFIFVAGGVPHAIGKGCFLAELQEPTDLMVIPERVTPSGVVLAEEKLHGGLGFDKMFDCFSYEGADSVDIYNRYFVKPKVVDENIKTIVDEKITDKFKFFEIQVDGKYVYKMKSYGIVLVIEGEGKISNIQVRMGDRLFVSENEKEINIEGKMRILLCRP